MRFSVTDPKFNLAGGIYVKNNVAIFNQPMMYYLDSNPSLEQELLGAVNTINSQCLTSMITNSGWLVRKEA